MGLSILDVYSKILRQTTVNTVVDNVVLSHLVLVRSVVRTLSAES